MKRYYAIQQAERTADIYIFGDIVPFEFFDGDVSAHGIVQQIKDLDVDTIRVHINSYGGAVSEGWAIYNALVNHPAKVETYGDGFIASAALYPFMAGDERHASTLSAYFFHEVMTGADGYAKDLRAAANEAEMLTNIGMNAFIERAGMSTEEVQGLMAAETWLSPGEALERGVATAIVMDTSPKFMQSIKREFMQKLIANPAEKKMPEPISDKSELPAQKTNNIMQLFKLKNGKE